VGDDGSTCADPLSTPPGARGVRTRTVTCGEPEDRLDVAFLEGAGLLRELPRWRQLVIDGYRL
jgi:hypothetical protein